MVRVKGHYRRAKSGKQIWVKGYNRSRGGFRQISVTISNPSIKKAEATYDPATKSTLLSFVDDDPDKSSFIMQDIPIKTEKIHIEEKGHIGLTVQSKGKKKKETTVIIETKKDV